jgi:hypothetical protein
MIMKISLAVAAFLCSSVLGQKYNNAAIPFDEKLGCTACIRGGWNFCVTIGGDKNNTIVTEGCEDKDRNPNEKIDYVPGGVASGYFCSHALMDEMNAIVGACRPYELQNLDDDCGSYFVDLSEKSDFEVGRSVLDLPVGTACTYRAWSTCGHPQVAWRVNDPKIVEDFDIAWAVQDGMQPSDELDKWNFTETPDFVQSFASNKTEQFV